MPRGRPVCIKTCQDATAVGKENFAAFEDRGKAFVREGKALEKMGNPEAAIEAYKNALVENRTKEVDRLLKTCELELKKKRAADYISPEKAQEAKEAGNACFRASDWPGAIKHYEEAVKRDPKNAPLRNNLAAALSKIMDFQGAKNAVDKAIELDPKYVKAYAKKGDIEYMMKDYHKALESYKAGLGIEPENALCTAGMQKTSQAIQEANSNMSEGEQRQRAERAMEDPEIQNIINDPVVKQVLSDSSKDPSALRNALADPLMRAKIEKLVAAGILKIN